MFQIATSLLPNIMGTSTTTMTETKTETEKTDVKTEEKIVTAQEEQERANYLLDAQSKAVSLFAEIEEKLIRPGISEKQLSDEIHALGEKRHGVRTHWHKRVVRSGPNTLLPFEDNPPDRVIEADDILYVDLGPVFEKYEADFARTFVLGDDPEKIKLRDSLEPVWRKVKERFDVESTTMTGDRLYEIACEEAKNAGWEFGAWLAGHLVGQFPHERIPRDKQRLYITKGNEEVMVTPGSDKHRRHWILEIHLRDNKNNRAAFFEQLLTVG
ncbi:Creatinase/aminopeptidase [Annulohypoxylon maeteangense]|uniref:Creatinase/aminopeptidase n=1 Tax=Annulohypoxylon maeteangense TaxID=1927788 RepID=UPI002007C7A5|nr:Creatinase/aminopeptidase [Annulohypoxylon maeteangense]KAI0888487.1 Creatinase/aminopeptidase [Annulohypoxylon maeteangense]